MDLFKKCIIFTVFFTLIHILVKTTNEEENLVNFFSTGKLIKSISSNIKKNIPSLNNINRKKASIQTQANDLINDSDKSIVDYEYQNSYYFLNNITSYQYYGIWNNSIPIKNFMYNSSGKLVVSITKNNSSIRNFIENIENYEVLSVTVLLYDGYYIDHWMKLVYNIHLDKNFSQGINQHSHNIKIDNEVTLYKVVGEYNDVLNITCI
jgi:hypothetical protein